MKSTRIIPTDESQAWSKPTVTLPDFQREDGSLIPRHTQEWRDAIKARNRQIFGEKPK